MASHTSSIGAITVAATVWEVIANLLFLAAIGFQLAQQKTELH